MSLEQSTSGNRSETYDEAKVDESDNRATSQLLETETGESQPCPQKKCVQPGGLKLIVTASISFALAVTIALVIDIYSGEHNIGHGAVSSDSEECSMLGRDVLKKGGSAVDAAIATSLCIGLVLPESSGIGGGGFMLVQSPEGKMKVIDFRETAPRNSTKDMFLNASSQMGGLSVAIPGEVKGFEIAHRLFGKLEWKDLFIPTINKARNGFKVLNSTKKWLSNASILKELEKLSPEFTKLYMEKGTIKPFIKHPKLANTLEIIAEQGSKGFYHGEIAESIVRKIQENNGILSLVDLKDYKVKQRKALSSSYQGYYLFTAGPPASGGVLLSAMNILEGFNLTKENASDPLVYHYIVETLKFVYAQRSRLADPHYSNDTQNLTKIMLSKTNAMELRKLIKVNMTVNDPHYYGPFFDAPPNKGTSHVSVIDSKGGIVSVTRTINTPFGSKLYTDTGILLNNEMDDFSSPKSHNFYGLAPSKANFIKHGKRPLSSMTPVIALLKSNLCGRQIALGGVGGSHITSAVIQVLFNMITFGRSLEDAIEWPRLHHQLDPMYVEVEEDRFLLHNFNITKYLEGKGNKVVAPPMFNTIVNGVYKHDGHLSGYADSRREDGGAAVY